jgi:hypothetical protein
MSADPWPRIVTAQRRRPRVNSRGCALPMAASNVNNNFDIHISRKSGIGLTQNRIAIQRLHLADAHLGGDLSSPTEEG